MALHTKTQWLFCTVGATEVACNTKGIMQTVSAKPNQGCSTFPSRVTARGLAHIVMPGIHFVEMKLTSLKFVSSNDGENSISNSRMIEARIYFASHIANRWPMQLRGPAEKGRYEKGRNLRLFWSTSSHRSGLKLSGSVQYCGCLCNKYMGIPIRVFGGIFSPRILVHSVVVRAICPILYHRFISKLKWS